MLASQAGLKTQSLSSVASTGSKVMKSLCPNTYLPFLWSQDRLLLSGRPCQQLCSRPPEKICQITTTNSDPKNLIQGGSLDLFPLEVGHGVHEVEANTALSEFADKQFLLLRARHIWVQNVSNFVIGESPIQTTVLPTKCCQIRTRIN